MHTKTKLSLFLGLAVATVPMFANAQTGTMFVTGDQVGVGTDAPDDKLHVVGQFRVEKDVADADPSAILNFETAAATWEIKQNGNTGRLVFFSPGGGAATAPFKFDRAATENLFRVGIQGASIVDINGELQINGVAVTPDYVFEKDYELLTIEEQAAYMWQNKHLPSIGAGKSDASGAGSVNIGHRSQAMLEELEKAHIYIDQLNSDLKQKNGQITDLESRLVSIEKALQAQK